MAPKVRSRMDRRKVQSGRYVVGPMWIDLFVDPPSRGGTSAALYDQIRDAITDGRLVCGDRLPTSRGSPTNWASSGRRSPRCTTAWSPRGSSTPVAATARSSPSGRRRPAARPSRSVGRRRPGDRAGAVARRRRRRRVGRRPAHRTAGSSAVPGRAMASEPSSTPRRPPPWVRRCRRAARAPCRRSPPDRPVRGPGRHRRPGPGHRPVRSRASTCAPARCSAPVTPCRSRTPATPAPAGRSPARGPRSTPVPVDAEGIVVDRTPRSSVTVRLRHAVAPGADRRDHVGATSAIACSTAVYADDLVVIEDDYDTEYRYVDRPLEPLHRLDTDGRVDLPRHLLQDAVAVAADRLRRRPAALVGDLLATQALADLHPPHLTQAALAHFIPTGGFDRHLRRTGAATARGASWCSTGPPSCSPPAWSRATRRAPPDCT